MPEKTLAEIARAAWMNARNKEDHWEITAMAVRDAVIEECAKIADYWAAGNWRLEIKHRSRFTIYDMQSQINNAGRGIAEDIRALLKTQCGQTEDRSHKMSPAAESQPDTSNLDAREHNEMPERDNG